MTMSPARRLAPYALALALVAIAAPALRDIGVAWDEALGDLYFGDRYLSQMLAFDASASPPSHPPSLALSPFIKYPWEYFPVANILAAATSRLLTPLGVDPFDGFHAVNLLLGAILLVALYRAVEKHESTAAALASVSFLFLSPRIAGDVLANIKDFPEMVFFALTLLLFFVAWERSSMALHLAAGAMWGLALGTKTNAVFVPVIFAIFLLVERGRARWLSLAGALALGPLVMFASWPWLWPNPARFYFNLKYISERAGDVAHSNPYLMILWSTPLVFLIFLIASPAFLRPLTPFRKLIAIWALVVLARLLLSANFDVVRHFLELFPALAVLAGIAFARIPRPAIAVPALAIVMAFPLVRSHPFETAYWNAISGESAEMGDYWAVSYRKGMEWLNAHAERDAFLAVPIAEHTVALPAPGRLRPDIRLLRYAPPTRPTQKPERLALLRSMAATRPVYVMSVLRENWANETTRYVTTLPPAAEWRSADGRTLLRIWRIKT